MIEMHYENHMMKEGHLDDSGIRLYFTKQLREHDLGLLMLGVNGAPDDIMIPAQTYELNLKTICYPQCTEVYIK
jgi:hypothetical protein